ncbi:carbohydrate-binding protein [Streptomyces olivaceus]|uniref:CBM35 domain-containing protein n=1 Tax=Streptomyces TaxID=1883 RepID=UPI0018A80338|nr:MULTISPECIES: CBM35 domain-containing protein [Streptomyces]MBF8174802.1 carbohydrate-binding protein [Streptomyces olivaceus]MBZ6173825.1 carbohydrate-binding protein [Streptomyces olivaceus]MBZ6180002.1 carbohydrate-binding protein [Streptomyces olivaceus]MBZ6251866.1 carbohydrate-binding protein [Streptomyces olivaceus]MBZ6258022.1 carbohydrate-binding protein [Streptomyces olivaceus]
MTPGNNGASTPEDDDPFGYLYADGQANGAQPPSGGYGYPNSVNRVRPVGARQYGAPQGQTAPTAAYGQAAPPQQGAYGQPQGAYGQPNAHYAAPETFPGGGGPGAPQQPSGRGGGGGRRGPNTKGLLIGAVAVVAAVVIGIAVAMTSSGSEDEGGGDEAGGDTAPTQSQTTGPSPSASDGGDEESAELPSVDAKAMRLGGSATLASDIDGAESEGGVYVSGFNQVGAKVTWTVDGIEKAGSYRLNVRYGTPGTDADATLVINGKASSRPMNMKNFGGTPEGDWEKGWKTTWSNVNLTEGTNTIELACNEGNKCDLVLDQLSLSTE